MTADSPHYCHGKRLLLAYELFSCAKQKLNGLQSKRWYCVTASQNFVLWQPKSTNCVLGYNWMPEFEEFSSKCFQGRSGRTAITITDSPSCYAAESRAAAGRRVTTERPWSSCWPLMTHENLWEKLCCVWARVKWRLTCQWYLNAS